MAKPSGKNLSGKEGGGQSQHWYDFVESRRRIKRSLRWDGGCPSSKPGVSLMVWLGFQDGKPQWGSIE